MSSRLRRVVESFGACWTADAVAIDSYLAGQVADASHRKVIGPLLGASGGSGVVWVAGREEAAWGDPTVPEMAFSVTKSVVAVVAGLAFDDGLLVPDQPVHKVVGLPEFRGRHNEQITWRHLLQQSSQWEGELWAKPTRVDAQSFREGTETHGTPPGQGWAYNDVRMNLLTYALTLLLRRGPALATHGAVPSSCPRPCPVVARTVGRVSQLSARPSRTSQTAPSWSCP